MRSENKSYSKIIPSRNQILEIKYHISIRYKLYRLKFLYKYTSR